MTLFTFNTKEYDTSYSRKVVNIFSPDLGNGEGFDLDLISIDTEWYCSNGDVTFASRDYAFRCHKLTIILQAICLGIYTAVKEYQRIRG